MPKQDKTRQLPLIEAILATLLLSDVYANNAYSDSVKNGNAPELTEMIKIPIGQQANNKQAVNRPTHGMTMQQVISQFGEPQLRQEPRGTPPISRWEYSDFIVYFENDIAIHSVLTP